MTDRGELVRQVCHKLANGDRQGAIHLSAEWPFIPKSKARKGKSPTPSKPEQMSVFVRDGFIDRYTGEKVVFTPALAVMGILLPKHWPFHLHSDQEVSHQATLDLWPSIDHRIPTSRGGDHDKDNWFTVSMRTNLIKGGRTLKEMGWSLKPAGDFSEWDGLTAWTFGFVEENPEILEHDHGDFVKDWCDVARKVLEDR